MDSKEPYGILMKAMIDFGHIPYQLHTLKSGSEVLCYLRREAPYDTVPVPDMILLDLSLPEKDGFEVLTELRQEAAFASIPIIILSGAQDFRNIFKLDRLWLSDCLPKPCSADSLLAAFGKLHSPKK
jgi:DNA-binding response OmpR family regulator